MKIRLVVLSFFVFLMSGMLWAQDEGLHDLRTNPVLVKKARELKRNGEQSKAKIKSVLQYADTLPFIDDFSQESVYPDPTKWLDNHVYINRTYPIAPRTIGVATFDGINSNGLPYDFSATSTSSLPADTLTSVVFKLRKHTEDDSLRLSFLWQAQGRGNAPETNDSLVLEFLRCFKDSITDFKDSLLYVVDTCVWDWKWAHKGYAPLVTDTIFHAELIFLNTPYLTCRYSTGGRPDIQTKRNS